MAYLRRIPGSPYWIAGFSLPDGRRTQRSTKTKDRKIAMKIAVDWEEASRRRITEVQARAVLSDIHELVHGTKIDGKTFREFCSQWLTRKQREVEAITYSSYRGATEDLIRFMSARADQPIHYVAPAVIASWRDDCARRATPRTANNKLKIVRICFQDAWRDGWITANPAAKVQALKTAKGDRRAFTIPELKAILSVANNEWRGMVLAGLYTGQRLKDIASLTWANVDLNESQIRLSTSKTHRTQVIPIAGPLLEWLEEAAGNDRADAPVFPQAFKHSAGERDTSPLSQQFHALLVAAGLAKPRPKKHEASGRGRSAPRKQNSVTFHSLRHTATSLLKATGASEAVARDIVGHESAAISRHYTHVDDTAKRSAIEKLPDITSE